MSDEGPPQDEPSEAEFQAELERLKASGRQSFGPEFATNLAGVGNFLNGIRAGADDSLSRGKLSDEDARLARIGVEKLDNSAKQLLEMLALRAMLYNSTITDVVIMYRLMQVIVGVFLVAGRVTNSATARDRAKAAEKRGKGSAAERGRMARAANDTKRIEAQRALLRDVLGNKPVTQVEKTLEALFGTGEAQRALNQCANAKGLPAFSKGTLRRRLSEMRSHA